MLRISTFVLLFLLFPYAYASANDPVGPVLFGLFVVFLSAKLGGYLAVKFHQTAVLGELLAGIVLGNLALLGYGGLEFIETDVVFETLAGIGAVLLLFEVGLDSNMSDLVKVGFSAFLVAIAGVVAPLLLGYYVGKWMLPEQSIYAHIFLGATLCATSVGITARVLKDLGKIHTNESKIILGAAVIDDVLGLIILAVVTAMIAQVNASGGGAASVDYTQIAFITMKAVGFLVGAMVVGLFLAPYFFRLGGRIKVEGITFAMSISTCFAFAYVASLAGLAPIVGAFAAGLIIETSAFPEYFPHEESSIEDFLVPISGFFVPIFFVTMGMKVEVASFFDPKVLALAAVITVAAIIGKQICAFAALGKGLNRLSIGIGMIPRGEVGLIFAAIGSQLVIGEEKIISQTLFSAIVVMVALTTVLTPPALKWALAKK